MATEEAQAEDVVRIRALYEAHAERIRSMLIRLTGRVAEAEDLLHDVFVVALRRAPSLRSEVELPHAWLYGIGVRLAQRSRKRVRLRELLSLEVAEEVADTHSQERHVEEREAVDFAGAALDRLSEKKRTVFILYELQGMTGEEISEALGCPLKTVWSRLLHARREFEAAVLRQRRLREPPVLRRSAP